MRRTKVLVLFAGAVGLSAASWACSEWFDSNLAPVPGPSDASHPADAPVVDGTTPDAAETGSDATVLEDGSLDAETDARDGGKKRDAAEAGDDAGDDAADGD